MRAGTTTYKLFFTLNSKYAFNLHAMFGDAKLGGIVFPKAYSHDDIGYNVRANTKSFRTAAVVSPA